MKPHGLLGDVARQLCWLFDGSIIGGFAMSLYLEQDTSQKDIDIVIPLDRWVQASKIIPQNAVLNRFGGVKFTDTNGVSVDCWADDIARVAFYSNKE